MRRSSRRKKINEIVSRKSWGMMSKTTLLQVKIVKWENGIRERRRLRADASLRMWPTLLWMFGWGTLGLQRHPSSTTTSTRCGMKSSGLRFVIKRHHQWHGQIHHRHQRRTATDDDQQCSQHSVEMLHIQSDGGSQVCHRADILEFDVRDKDHAYTEEIGKVTTQITQITQLILILTRWRLPHSTWSMGNILTPGFQSWKDRR